MEIIGFAWLIKQSIEFLIPIIIVIASLLFAYLFSFIFKRYLLKFAERTETELDDKVLKAFEKPIFWIILLSGFYLAIISFKPLYPYREHVDKAFTIFVILIGVYVSVKIVSGVIGWYGRRDERVYRTFAGIRNLLDALIYIFAIILVLYTLGYDVTALAAGLGIAALAVALAFQSTLSNFFAGIYITAERTVRIGDYVELENGLAGYVEEIGWRSTKIRTFPNNLIVIPNTKLAESIVTDYHAPTKEMGVVIPCGVSYGSDLEKVESITIMVAKEVLRNVKGGLPDFEPFILYHNFGNSNIEFNVILRVREFVDKFTVTHEFIKELKKAYDKEGIEIAFPCTNVYMRK